MESGDKNPDEVGTGFPLRGRLGIGMTGLFWILNWTLPGIRTHWGFFPLWLGYCLTVDALVQKRKGHSLWTRSRPAYIGLFCVSVPAWWLFELINLRTLNWVYDGKQHFTDLEYFLWSSLSFSTVMPAVFGTAELASTFRWLKKIPRGPSIRPTPKTLFVLFTAGFLMMTLLLFRPLYFFPFAWVSVYFILEPINVLLGNRSILEHTRERDWGPVLTLWTGSLTCGLFWEMWNYWSYPKWIYRVPFVDFLHVFEMPLLGYCGYLPFALELFALYHLTMGLIRPAFPRNFIQIAPCQSER